MDADALLDTRRARLDRRGRLDERFEGAMRVELPDTVVVLHPGQSAGFDDLGGLFGELPIPDVSAAQ